MATRGKSTDLQVGALDSSSRSDLDVHDAEPSSLARKPNIGEVRPLAQHTCDGQPRLPGQQTNNGESRSPMYQHALGERNSNGLFDWRVWILNVLEEHRDKIIWDLKSDTSFRTVPLHQTDTPNLRTAAFKKTGGAPKLAFLQPPAPKDDEDVVAGVFEERGASAPSHDDVVSTNNQPTIERTKECTLTAPFKSVSSIRFQETPSERTGRAGVSTSSLRKDPTTIHQGVMIQNSISSVPTVLKQYSKAGWKNRTSDEESHSPEISSETMRKIRETISMKLFKRQRIELQRFDYCIGVLILLNTIVMVVQLEWMGHKSGVALGIHPDDGSWKNAELIFKVLEHVFNAIFALELVVRVYFLKLSYFEEISNILDILLVVTCSTQLFILEPLGEETKGAFVFVRVFRLLRAVRVLRVVRIFKMFQELRILVSTFLSSMQALAWAMLFLSVVVLVAALFLSYSIQDYMQEDNDRSVQLWLYKHYGDSKRSTYALFEATLSGCWPKYFRPLVEKVSGWFFLFIVVYVGIVIFGLTRIITAMFVKETLRASQADAETQAAEQFKKRQMYVTKLRETFHALDCSGDGVINHTEFKRMCCNNEVQVILRMLELEVEDADIVFNMLDTNGVGKITYEDFLRGVMRLKGQARSLDMVALQITTDAMHSALDDVHRRVYKMEKSLSASLAEPLTDACEPPSTITTSAFTFGPCTESSSLARTTEADCKFSCRSVIGFPNRSSLTQF